MNKKSTRKKLCNGDTNKQTWVYLQFSHIVIYLDILQTRWWRSKLL